MRRSLFFHVDVQPVCACGHPEPGAVELHQIPDGERFYMKNEIGYSVCETSRGKLVAGPVAEGTPTSVNIPLSCPAGSKLAYLQHTHPGGIAKPSAQDVKSAYASGAKGLCITVPETGETNCFRIRGR